MEVKLKIINKYINKYEITIIIPYDIFTICINKTHQCFRSASIIMRIRIRHLTFLHLDPDPGGGGCYLKRKNKTNLNI